MLSLEKIQSLYAYFTGIPDPSRAWERCHSLTTMLALSTATVLT